MLGPISMTRSLWFGLPAVLSFFGPPVSVAADPPTIDVLRERENRIKDVVSQAIPAVVAITSENPTGTGSGVVVSKDGIILTAAHVTEAIVSDGGGKRALTIIFPDGRQAKAVALGSNRCCDASMVKISEPANQEWPHIELGCSDEMKKGDWVIALGQPGGFDPGRTPPVRAGRVWARDNFGSFYTDCTLIGGDSGGPLLNLSGNVVGIHSSIGGPLAVNRHVAVDNFKIDWDRLVKGETWGELELARSDPERPVLGVELDEESSGGVRVVSVVDGGPAEKAGLKNDDFITHFAGQEVKSYLNFIRLISRREPGESVKLGLRRGDDERLEIEIALASSEDVRRQRSAPPKFADRGPQTFLGLELDATSGPGVRIVSVERDSPAAAAGVRDGDVITDFNGSEVGDALDLARALSAAKPGEKARLKVRRGDSTHEIEATLSQR
jgi:serine protease Do